MTHIEKFIQSRAIERPRITKDDTHTEKENELRQLFFVHAKRMKALEEKYGPVLVWDDEVKTLLSSYFGPMVEHIINGFDIIRYSLLSRHWTRRSFKAPNSPELYFHLQLQWVNGLYQSLAYNFSLEEYVRYSSWINEDGFGCLFAGAVEAGNESVLELMLDIVYGRDSVGKVSYSIIKALLLLDRDDAREAIEKLLLSAQREEGLRQLILEQIDAGHPNNFKYFLKVIQQNGLTRFSSMVRAFDTWTGLDWKAPKEKTVKRAIELALEFMNNPASHTTALSSRDNLEVYMALWTSGVEDLSVALKQTAPLLEGDNESGKLVALYFLYQVYQSTGAQLEIDFHSLLKVQSLAVVTLAFWCLGNFPAHDRFMDDLIEVIKRFPDKQTVKSGIFDWMEFQYDPHCVYSSCIASAKRSERLDELLPMLDKMDADSRIEFSAKYLNVAAYSYHNEPKMKELTPKQCAFALDRLSDRSSSVQDIAFRSLGMMNTLTREELKKVEELLSRKAAAMRKNCVNLLMRQPLESILSVIENLSEAKSVEKRIAAIDMLVQLQKQECDNSKFFELIKVFKSRSKITVREEKLLENFGNDEPQLSRENGFGLYSPDKLLKVKEPQRISCFDQAEENEDAEKIFRYSLSQEKILEELKKLDKLIEESKSYEFERETWNGEKETVILFNILNYRYSTYSFCKEKIKKTYPMIDQWQVWFEESGLTIIDLCLLTDTTRHNLIKGEQWVAKLARYVYSDLLKETCFHKEIKYMTQVRNTLDILFEFNFNSDCYNFLIDISETTFSLITEEQLNAKVKEFSYSHNLVNWRTKAYFTERLKILNTPVLFPTLNDKQIFRVWSLFKWYYGSMSTSNKKRHPESSLYCELFKRKLINKTDFYDFLFEYPIVWSEFIPEHSGRRFCLNKDYPFLNEIMPELVETVLEIELKRGDSPTNVTSIVPYIPQVHGQKVFFAILQGIAKEPFVRTNQYSWAWCNEEYLTKRDLFSMLLKRCSPEENESVKTFLETVKTLKIKESRLIEAALYAPQWMNFVEKALGWESFLSACWWLHAHTNEHLNAMKESEIGNYSQVKATDFANGAVDVKWFFEFYNNLGEKNWKVLYKSAKYISESAGHRRAQIFADALLNKLKLKEVESKIIDKRNKDFLRAYGLIPLSKKKRSEDLLHRYKFITQFKKESRQFGSQRQASEKVASKIALENLSRNAGYADPIRLTWAMECQAAQDILEKAKPVEIGEVTVSLKITDDGQANLQVEKSGKALKAIPVKLRKNSDILELKEYAKALKEQYKRSRGALEEAMVAADEFTAGEIGKLMNHPVVAPLLNSLVFKLKGSNPKQLGFWENGKLAQPGGTVCEVTENDKLTIAHCLDLFNSEKWSEFQKYCFENKLKQPFKQIFREMYLPTPDEQKSATVSRRYAGHQIQPGKAAALLKSRGWTIDYEEGLKKVFPDTDYMVKIYAQTDWFTPADVEAPTIETIEFYQRNSYKNVPFSEIHQIHFSEIMRDLDLVVSVAHSGEVDPEASHSTIEMRSLLADETARMLSLTNVSSQKSHLLIEGKLKRYSLHLGSGVVHCQPGGALSILPVHSSHRGRIFLPFADNDPKIAEILSKMLLLANDDKIKDPTILSQINYVGANSDN